MVQQGWRISYVYVLQFLLLIKYPLNCPLSVQSFPGKQWLPGTKCEQTQLWIENDNLHNSQPSCGIWTWLCSDARSETKMLQMTGRPSPPMYILVQEHVQGINYSFLFFLVLEVLHQKFCVHARELYFKHTEWRLTGRCHKFALATGLLTSRT